MSLNWMPRDDSLKRHDLVGDRYWGTMEKPPCTVYEKVPVRDPEGRDVEGLFVARITLNKSRFKEVAICISCQVLVHT